MPKERTLQKRERMVAFRATAPSERITVLMSTQATSKRGPYRKGVETRSQIVQAATRVFAKSGYAGSSLRQIAAEVGVSAASLLQHFGSKEGLLTAVLEEWEKQTAYFANDLRDPAEVIPLTRRQIASHLKDRGLVELFLRLSTEASNEQHPAHAFVLRRYETVRQNARRTLIHAQEMGAIRRMTADELDAEVHILLAVQDGLQLQWLLDENFDVLGALDVYLRGTWERWGANRDVIGGPGGVADGPEALTESS
jgi:AcrR family transcriptional regulator